MKMKSTACSLERTRLLLPSCSRLIGCHRPPQPGKRQFTGFQPRSLLPRSLPSGRPLLCSRQAAFSGRFLEIRHQNQDQPPRLGDAANGEMRLARRARSRTQGRMLMPRPRHRIFMRGPRLRNGRLTAQARLKQSRLPSLRLTVGRTSEAREKRLFFEEMVV